jgi:hypothetical protein
VTPTAAIVSRIPKSAMPRHPQARAFIETINALDGECRRGLEAGAGLKGRPARA